MILTWFVGGSLSKSAEGLRGAGMGLRHRLDREYKPVSLRLTMLEAPTGSVDVEVLKDGVSIKDGASHMDPLGTYKEHDTFVTGTLAKDSVLSLSVSPPTNFAAGRDLTVELELAEV